MKFEEYEEEDFILKMNMSEIDQVKESLDQFNRVSERERENGIVCRVVLFRVRNICIIH